MIICSRCLVPVTNILEHYAEHHGIPQAKVTEWVLADDRPYQPNPTALDIARAAWRRHRVGR